MMGVGARMQLDGRRAEVARGADGALVGVDEEARTYSGGIEARNTGCGTSHVVRQIKAALGGDLLAFLGHERRLMRFELHGEAQHLLGARHLEVQHRAHFACETPDVVVLDVAAIFAKMRGDSIRSGVLADARGRYRIRFVAAARLPERRDVIDVDVKALAAHVCHPLAFRMRVKKLAVLAVLALSACHRQVKVGSSPTANTPGGASPREALQFFMAAAKAQDLQAFSNVWGTPAR